MMVQWDNMLSISITEVVFCFNFSILSQIKFVFDILYEYDSFENTHKLVASLCTSDSYLPCQILILNYQVCFYTDFLNLSWSFVFCFCVFVTCVICN